MDRDNGSAFRTLKSSSRLCNSPSRMTQKEIIRDIFFQWKSRRRRAILFFLETTLVCCSLVEDCTARHLPAPYGFPLRSRCRRSPALRKTRSKLRFEDLEPGVEAGTKALSAILYFRFIPRSATSRLKSAALVTCADTHSIGGKAQCSDSRYGMKSSTCDAALLNHAAVRSAHSVEQFLADEGFKPSWKTRLISQRRRCAV